MPARPARAVRCRLPSRRLPLASRYGRPGNEDSFWHGSFLLRDKQSYTRAAAATNDGSSGPPAWGIRLPEQPVAAQAHCRPPILRFSSGQIGNPHDRFPVIGSLDRAVVPEPPGATAHRRRRGCGRWRDRCRAGRRIGYRPATGCCRQRAGERPALRSRPPAPAEPAAERPPGARARDGARRRRRQPGAQRRQLQLRHRSRRPALCGRRRGRD